MHINELVIFNNRIIFIIRYLNNNNESLLTLSIIHKYTFPATVKHNSFKIYMIIPVMNKLSKNILIFMAF